MSGCPSAGCGRSGLSRRDYVLCALFFIGVVAAGTAGAAVGYLAGYGLAVLAVLAATTILLYIVIGFAAPFWVIPASMFVAMSFLVVVDMALGFPVAGTSPWGDLCV